MSDVTVTVPSDATVWCLVWRMNGLEHRTQWTIHYDLVRGLLDDYQENWPGCDVHMEQATVSEVTDVHRVDFGTEREGDDD